MMNWFKHLSFALSMFLCVVIVLGEENQRRSLHESRVLSVEPAPILGDCPCTKVDCGASSKGVKGDKGDPGPQGPRGDKGSPGLKGSQGDKGHPGTPGVAGPPGKTGLPGKHGHNGTNGDQGPPGPKGNVGPQGPQGLKGDKGDHGVPGAIGPPGKQGPKGLQGIQGDKGQRGPPGQQGNQGPKGPPGLPGTQGPQGNIGPHGPRGSTGSTGPQGQTGSRGPVGPQGDKGPQGLSGAMGQQGPQGPPGMKGDQGPKGDAGSCPKQCADMKKELLEEIKKLQAQIDNLKPTPPPTSLPSLGSRDNPGLSCKHIKQHVPSAVSGAYYLKTDTASGSSVVYCHMTALGPCSGSGWTMVMKLDGNKQTFTYSSPRWSNKIEYQPYYGKSGFGYQETKLATYWSTGFSHLCLGMRTKNSAFKFLKIHYPAKSLYDVIADGKYKALQLGRDAWKALVNGGSLQMHCNKEGFNVDTRLNHYIPSRARIGIVANKENDCMTCDSRIGLGTDGVFCGQDNSNSCGNEAHCSPDNGDRSTKTYGYIFVH